MDLPVKMASRFGVLGYWSARVYEIPNSKHQTGDPPAGWGVQAKRGQFWSLLFEICDLEFSVTVADCRKREESIEAPSGAAQS
jgi:hypothetical protein